MTDNEIMIALRRCAEHGKEYFRQTIAALAWDLMYRQKAEIERLQKHNTEMARKHYQDGRTEAVKEFAERLIEDRLGFVALENVTDEYAEGYHDALCCVEEQVDNLVKEFTEGDAE